MAGGSIPAQLAPIFNAAGKAYGVPPPVLAGISSVESNLFQNMGPSSAGAIGGMQFLPATARGLGVNPNDPRSSIFGAAKLLVQYGYRQNPVRAIGAYNGGPGNPQMGYAQQVLSEAARLAPQLGGPRGAGLPTMGAGGGAGAPGMLSFPVTTQSFDQAGYGKARDRFIAGQALSQTAKTDAWGTGGGADLGSNPLFASGLLSTKAPNPANYVTQQTSLQQAAVHGLQQLAGTGLVNAHAGAQGYVNPIPGAVVGRTDMGVDANLKPGAPIRAIGDSKVLGIMPNWFHGQPYLALQLTSGPRSGQVYYVAEQIQPQVRPGQTVRAGQPIATFAPQGTGIEIGWASPRNWQQTLAQASGNTGDSSHGNAPAGVNFRSFLGELGG